MKSTDNKRAIKYTADGKSNTFSNGNWIAKKDPSMSDNVAKNKDSVTSCEATEDPLAPIALRRPISPLR